MSNHMFLVRGWPEGECQVGEPSYQVVMADTHPAAELIALQRQECWQHPTITMAFATELP